MGSCIKKTQKHPKACTNKRAVFKSVLRHYKKENRSLIYIDESGFSVSAPRPNGYSKIEVRCAGTHNWHERGRINVIGALIKKELVVATLFDCSIDTDVFYAWTTQELIPKLPENSVVILDNASFHRRWDIQAAIINAGHTLLFQPPYSPDLNPIEHKWAQLKSIRRKKRCSVDELFEQL